MTTFHGIYDLATEIFDNLMWSGTEAVIYAADAEDTYNVAYRQAGSFGDPEHEYSIICTVDLSPPMWIDSLADWGIDPDLIGTTDLDEDLAHDYIAGALTDHIRYRMDERFYDLDQTAREYKESEQ